MKKFIPLLLLSVIILFSACKKDDDKAVQTETVELQLDKFMDGGNKTFVGNLKTNEEAAVTLGPVSNTFQVTYVNFYFGGTGNTPVSKDVTLKIYKDNGSANPGALIFSGPYTMISSLTTLHNLDLRSENIKVSGGGSIRVAIEFEHDGFPSIAQDDGNDYDPLKNWIKDTNGAWASSDGLGLNGNYIIRATVEEEI
jgi:hypothetical protein